MKNEVGLLNVICILVGMGFVAFAVVTAIFYPPLLSTDNLFITISARQLNPKLRIVSKAIDLQTRAKLMRAGADGVVSSNFIGGLRIASELLRPTVVSFLDVMMRPQQVHVDLHLKLLARQSRRGLGAAERKLARPRLRQRDQFADIVGRHRRVDHHHPGRGRHQCRRRKIPDDIEG